MTHVDIMRTVAAYVKECVGEVETTPSGVLLFPFGSTRISISGSAAKDHDSTFVQIRSHVADDVRVSNELLQWVSTASNDLALGHVTLEFQGDRTLATLEVRHTLLGDYLQLEEIRLALALVATEADRLDDFVVEKFGGKRFSDHS